MNGRIIQLGLLLSMLVIVPALGQSGGDYELSLSAIGGGGVVSSGGDFELSVTIGEPEAGESAGGDFELSGGILPSEHFCIVDFEHFARLAEWWLYIGDCSADLYDDNVIDWLDVDELVYEWLYVCPHDWPLK